MLTIIKYPNRKFYIKGNPQKYRTLHRSPESKYRCGYMNLSEIEKYIKEAEQFEVICAVTKRNITNRVLESMAMKKFKTRMAAMTEQELRYYTLNNGVSGEY